MIALITGAKGGLGTFVTRAFLDAGAQVFGTSRSIRKEDFPHPAFTAIPAELTNLEAAQTLVASLPRIDVAVHLLGAYEGGTAVADTDASVLDRMLDLNLRSAFFLAKAVLPGMRAQGSGRFLAIASRSAVEPVALSGAYNLSKAALVSLVKTIAIENADRGIPANVVLPATMDTP
ncbi:MAG: SDR family oxidoreductase [Bryobacteraceae bacterium]